jgi:hypothetical protein
VTVAALAYINQGRLVADCPRPHCGNAEQLAAWQPWFRCTSRWCGIEAPVKWPPDLEDLAAALAVRGAPQFMNWYPGGHPVALAAGVPHGQSAADLHAENREHAAEIAAWHGFPALGGRHQAVASVSE